MLSGIAGEFPRINDGWLGTMVGHRMNHAKDVDFLTHHDDNPLERLDDYRTLPPCKEVDT